MRSLQPHLAWLWWLSGLLHPHLLLLLRHLHSDLRLSRLRHSHRLLHLLSRLLHPHRQLLLLLHSHLRILLLLLHSYLLL